MFLSYSRPGHRFEDVPGMRRHLVRKSTKGQVVHIGKDHKEPTTRSRKQDHTPHEVRRHTAYLFSISFILEQDLCVLITMYIF